MNTDKIEQLFIMNASKFPPETYGILKEQMMKCDEARLMMIMSQMKDPTIAFVLSICLGYLGIDRFYIGSIGMGVGKLITGGACGIWTIIDLFFIMDATRQRNYEQAMLLL